MTKVENHINISLKLGIWITCFLVASSTYVAKVDIGALGILCWAVVIGGIILCLLDMIL